MGEKVFEEIRENWTTLGKNMSKSPKANENLILFSKISTFSLLMPYRNIFSVEAVFRVKIEVKDFWCISYFVVVRRVYMPYIA